MKFLRETLGIAACLMFEVSALASNLGTESGLSASLAGFKGLRVERNAIYESNYPGTACINLLQSKSGNWLGLVCRSRNREFVADMGIIQVKPLIDPADPNVRLPLNLVVATPMAQYSMSPMAGVGAHVASATVDCDADGQAIYRATATCHVAITSPLEGEVTYTNIVSRYHVGHRVGLTQARIVEIWKRLEHR